MEMQSLFGQNAWRHRYGGSQPPTVVTIGNFDGIHLGHQRILRYVMLRAAALDALGVALTFEPHPLKILRPESAPPLISTLSQRLSRMEEIGVDATLVLPFNQDLSQLSPEEFVRRFLVETLHARLVLVGENFRFGHKGSGDVEQLRALGTRLGFGVEIVPPVVFRGQVVSSTIIRDCVRAGDVQHAARLLGRPFFLTGRIVPGTGTGRREVVPTLNLEPEQELLPAGGVYVTETWLALAPGEGTRMGLPRRREGTPGRVYRSVTNIGVRPTFSGTRLAIESHLFDFSADLTEGMMGVGFWHRVREEKKFDGAAELKEQIQRDLEGARKFFARLDAARRARRAGPRPSLRARVAGA